MDTYDFRLQTEDINNATANIDKLSNRQLIELAKAADQIRQRQEEQRLIKAKGYFNVAILPGLKDFAETSGALLYVEEHDEKETVQVIFKNETGFDITESCHVTGNLLSLANYIGIMTEENDIALSLVYEYKRLMDA